MVGDGIGMTPLSRWRLNPGAVGGGSHRFPDETVGNHWQAQQPVLSSGFEEVARATRFEDATRTEGGAYEGAVERNDATREPGAYAAARRIPAWRLGLHAGAAVFGRPVSGPNFRKDQPRFVGGPFGFKFCGKGKLAPEAGIVRSGIAGRRRARRKNRKRREKGKGFADPLHLCAWKRPSARNRRTDRKASRAFRR